MKECRERDSRLLALPIEGVQLVCLEVLEHHREPSVAVRLVSAGLARWVEATEELVQELTTFGAFRLSDGEA